MKIISQQQIRAQNITPATCVDWIKESFAIKKMAELPSKISVHPKDGEFFTSMPCLLPAPDMGGINFERRYFGVKEVHRLLNSVPSLGSDMMLYDAETGELLALLDTDWITTMRTGAVAALSSKVLRKSNADTYGIVGLGNTARATLLCILEQEPERNFPVKLVRYKDQAELFIERFKAYNNVSFEIIDDKNAFASEADVLISCVTVATELLFPDDTLLKKGVTVIPVHVRGFQNCDLFFDKVFGDDTGQIQKFKYFNQFREYDEIHHVLQGKNPGRTNDDERILSYNYGIALHDIVFASRIYEKAEANGVSFEYIKQNQKIWV